MVIQNLSKPIAYFFEKIGFVVEYSSGRILKEGLYVGRFDTSEWVDLRVSPKGWEIYEKEIKKIVEEYEKFSGLQVFIKIS